ncbi:sigma-70 family RNA polymerase sigma factor [Nannocystis punicea]|uniref:Sigma-70 family RNA polymerase sigma factor n=1 Tax=Nannocystis punicea TaxID=2995304 RepID=A0ABY7HJB9_9BACT|nr:sigma-70 family RNA polymerase sigma factor [Nannocystis poenicansa]WAS99213.1 sigma-70 family RNA polymerase sigma factor [Nannocystis poenicansa]
MRSEPQPDDARMRTFRELYLAEFTFVWATARRYGVPPTLVEDAVQDVFMTAYRRLDQVRFEVSARAWLHGVTRRIAARYRRTAARLSRRLAAVAAVPPDPTDPPHDRLAAAQQLERLLARLAGPTRAAFEMAELYGMSGPEIAGELGIPVATVYSRVRLAREQLLRELGGPGLERELAAARTREAPPPAAAQRTWAAMLPGLWTTRAGVGLAVLASARAAVMTTLVVAAGAVAIAWPKGQIEDRAALVAPARDGRLQPTASGSTPAADLADPRPLTAPSATQPGSSHDSASRAQAGASHDSPSSAHSSAGRDSDDSSRLPGDAGSHHSPAASPAKSTPGSPASASSSDARSREASAPDSRPAASLGADDELVELARTTHRGGDADELAAEVAVLDRARAELARGDVAAARAHLTEHARSFPAGQFTDLRGATEIELLCRQGDRARAVAQAAALVTAHPRSAVAQRFKNFSCPD